MRRRDFILACTVGVASVAPSLVRAQDGRTPVIGFIGSATERAQQAWTKAFVERLRVLGWIDGRSVEIAYRWAEGRADRAAEAARDLVARKVDLIVTNGTPVILAAKRATSEIPIVFAAAGDPVGTGLVAALARPGGNLTGLSLQASDLAGKHLELLREAVPGLRRVALIVNVNAANAVVQMREAQAAAKTLGLETSVLEIRNGDDIAGAIERAAAAAQALYVMNEPLTVTHRAAINTLALQARLPTVYAFREFVESGGLMSYGPSFPDLFARAAEFVDKILRGAKPAEIPVEQPTKFDLVVNLKTATALGLDLSPALVGRADEVIE